MRIIAAPAFRNRSANPYNWLLYSQLQALGHEVSEFSTWSLFRSRYDILHIHWPDFMLSRRPRWRALLNGVQLLLLLKIAKMLGTRLVWTVHNLHSHEQPYPRMEAWFMQAVSKLVDGYISLSESGRVKALQHFPVFVGKPGFVIPHGHYKDVYPSGCSRPEARATLGIKDTDRVILFSGQIRPYKNVPDLVRIFSAIPGSDLCLLIAGKPSSVDLVEEIRAAAAKDPRIVLRLGFIPNDMLQVYFHAADLVVLPYQEVLNSGSAILALSFNVPVLLPDRGAMAELAQICGGDWVKLFSGELDGEKVLAALALTRQRGGCGPDVSSLEWAQLAADTTCAYWGVIDAATSLIRAK